MSSQRLRYEGREGTAFLHWDDGKSNSVSSETLGELNAALDRAEQEAATAIAIVGRPGVFCAGFDLKELGAGGDTMRALVRTGAELLVRLYRFPLPVVMGCSGHALGMGALVLLSADVRFGSAGEHKIGAILLQRSNQLG